MEYFEKRIIELLETAEYMIEERAPYRYIRQRVKSQGIEFYIYQGSLENKQDSYVKDLNLNTLGAVSSETYWNKVAEYREKQTKNSLKKIMGG